MIFGFNTDVKHGDTIYHVQSEARESGNSVADPGLRTRALHRQEGNLLRDLEPWKPVLATPRKSSSCANQHRLVLDAIREGKLENVLDHAETEALAAV